MAYKTGLASISLDKWQGTKLENNEKLTDTSGYIPLKIRLKKLDLASAAAKLSRAQFDYHDYEELYDSDIVFDRFDDVDTIEEKMKQFNERKMQLVQAKRERYFAEHPEKLEELSKIQQERIKLQQQQQAVQTPPETKQMNSNGNTETEK